MLDALLHLLNLRLDRPLPRHPRHAADPGFVRLFAAQAQADPLRPARRSCCAGTKCMAWLGSLLVLVHAGIHFNAILGWLAVGAMLINVASGLTGKFLLERSRRRLEEARQRMRQQACRRRARRAALLGQPDLRRGQAVARRFTSRSRWRLPCWRWRTSSRCSCSGAGSEARRWLMEHHRGQPGRAGRAGLRLPAPDGQPGPLVPGHAELATDCFACHAPLRGASSDALHRLPCRGRHRPAHHQGRADRPAARVKSSFHQELIEQDCMACHSDHQAPKLTQRSRKAFSHALLRPTVRERCDGLPCRAQGHRPSRPQRGMQPVPRDRALEAGHLRPCPAGQRAGRNARAATRRHRTSCIGRCTGSCKSCHSQQAMEARHLRSRQALRARPRSPTRRASPATRTTTTAATPATAAMNTSRARFGEASRGGHPELRELRRVPPQRRRGTGHAGDAWREKSRTRLKPARPTAQETNDEHPDSGRRQPLHEAHAGLTLWHMTNGWGHSTPTP